MERFHQSSPSSATLADGKKALEALQESEQRFRITFTGAAIAMAIIGLDGEFLGSELSITKRCWGYTEAQLRSMRLIQVTHTEDRAVGIHLFEQMLENKWEHYQIEQRYINARRPGGLGESQCFFNSRSRSSPPIYYCDG